MLPAVAYRQPFAWDLSPPNDYVYGNDRGCGYGNGYGYGVLRNPQGSPPSGVAIVPWPSFQLSPSVAPLASTGELRVRSAYALETAEERTFSYFAFGVTSRPVSEISSQSAASIAARRRVTVIPETPPCGSPRTSDHDPPAASTFASGA